MPIENALASVAVRDVHAAVIWYESLGPPARPIRRYAVLKTEQNASSIARNLAANSLILICSVLYSEQEGPKTPQKLRNRLPIYNERRDWNTKGIPYAAFSRILFGTAFSALKGVAFIDNVCSANKKRSLRSVGRSKVLYGALNQPRRVERILAAARRELSGHGGEQRERRECAAHPDVAYAGPWSIPRAQRLGGRQ